MMRKFVTIDGTILLVLMLMITTSESFWGHPLCVCHPRSSGAKMTLLTASTDDEQIVSDEMALMAMEQIEKLDAKLGVNCGAARERQKLARILEEWERAVAAAQCENDEDDGECLIEEYGDSSSDDNEQQWSITDSSKLVQRHSADDRVAIFGGNPARRRQIVEKRLKPFNILDQYGTPRDVGSSDANVLIKKIRQGSYDVVYLWTRFNNHGMRGKIREVCSLTETRYEEVESLSYIASSDRVESGGEMTNSL